MWVIILVVTCTRCLAEPFAAMRRSFDESKRLFDIQQDILHLRSQINKLNKRKDMRRRKRQQHGFAQRDVAVTLAILVLGEHNINTATQFLRSRHSLGHPTPPPDALTSLVSQWFMDASDETLLLLTDPTTQGNINICKSVRKRSAE
jgi:hypothetical protein